MDMLRKLSLFLDRIIDGAAIIAGFLLLFMTFSIGYDVLMRYFFLQPTAWAVDITEYILLYITFLGAPWLLKKKGHVKVDVIHNLLSVQKQMILDLATSFFGVLICIVLFWFGILTTYDHYIRKIPVIKTLEVPKFILLAVIPFGSLLLCAQFIRQAMASLKSFKQKEIVKKKEDLETGL